MYYLPSLVRQKSTFLEQLAFKVGDTPCASHLFRGDNSTTPQQTTISCLASKHSVAIAANVFTVNESSKDVRGALALHPHVFS